MKKVLVLFGAATILALFLFPSYSSAEFKLYEKGDFKISLNEMTACVLWDMKNAETLAGLKTSILEYKQLNFDIGCIGDYDNFDNIDIFVGLSIDTTTLKINDNIYGSIGLFASPGWIDSGPVRYGGYTGLAWEF